MIQYVTAVFTHHLYQKIILILALTICPIWLHNQPFKEACDIGNITADTHASNQKLDADACLESLESLSLIVDQVISLRLSFMLTASMAFLTQHVGLKVLTCHVLAWRWTYRELNS